MFIHLALPLAPNFHPNIIDQDLPHDYDDPYYGDPYENPRILAVMLAEGAICQADANDDAFLFRHGIIDIDA